MTMNGYVDFNGELSQVQSQLAMVYDGVATTSNKKLLAICTDGKVGIITAGGTLVLPCIFNIEDIKVWGDILEYYSCGGYVIERITIGKDLKTYRNRKLISARKDNKGDWDTCFCYRSFPSRMMKSRPKIMGTTKDAIILSIDGSGSSLIITTKNAVVHNDTKYLKIVEVKFKNELLGIHFITIDNNMIHRAIDILDHVGRLKRRVDNWGREEVGEYGVGLATLYSRGLVTLNKKGDII